MRVIIALGTNLGDRAQAMEAATEFLRGLATDGILKAATALETEPVDCPPGSQNFLNSVIQMEWDGTPRELLTWLKEWERSQGRVEAREVNSPRPIDLDIIAFGDVQMEDADLIIPHPRAHLRRFVLEPLAEIDPNLILPGQQKSVSALLKNL